MKTIEHSEKIKKLMGFMERNKEKFPFSMLIDLEDFFIKFYISKRKYYKARILPGRKAIYFPIEKVATRSLFSVFDPNNKKVKPIKKEFFKRYKDHFKFTFVRNPYDRLVSCYEDKIMSDRKKEDLLIKNELYKKMPFKEFVKAIYSISDIRADQHIKSQYFFVADRKGNLLVDFIGKFENLQDDYKKICKKLGIKKPKKLPTKNKSKRKKDYREYYDKETKRLVYERYKKDFEMFGYSKKF